MLLCELKYDYEPSCPAVPPDRVEDVLKMGKIFQMFPDSYTLLQIVNGKIEYETIDFVRCVMDGGLRAIFMPESSYANEATDRIPIETLVRRFRAVYEVSRWTGLGYCPVVVIRSLPGLGRGLLIPAIKSKSLVFVQMVEGRPRIAYRGKNTSPLQVNECMVFDYLVGSGQRLWYAYQVDEMGNVYSAHHFRAFSFTAAGRIAGALLKRKARIREEFIKTLEGFENRRGDKPALIQELMVLVGVESTKMFDLILDRLLDDERVGDHVRVELVGEDDDIIL